MFNSQSQFGLSVPEMHLWMIIQSTSRPINQSVGPSTYCPVVPRNNDTQLCEPCQVVGCKRCASKESSGLSGSHQLLGWNFVECTEDLTFYTFLGAARLAHLLCVVVCICVRMWVSRVVCINSAPLDLVLECSSRNRLTMTLCSQWSIYMKRNSYQFVVEDTCAECFENFWPEFGGRVCAAWLGSAKPLHKITYTTAGHADIPTQVRIEGPAGIAQVYVWDDRAQHGMNAAFAFSLLLILLLLAGLECTWPRPSSELSALSSGVYLIDRCNCWGRCLPQEIDSSPDAMDDEEAGQQQQCNVPPRYSHSERQAASISTMKFRCSLRLMQQN